MCHAEWPLTEGVIIALLKMWTMKMTSELKHTLRDLEGDTLPSRDNIVIVVLVVASI